MLRLLLASDIMKRYLITLIILSLSFGLKAQSAYTYHYWFDQDTEHRQTGPLDDGHLLLDADALESGMHMLHLHLFYLLCSSVIITPAPQYTSDL